MSEAITPSQQAKDYAAANGFTIATVGRRYQATHATGVSFERGGYTALLNEMRAVVGCIENGNAHPVHGFAVDADAPVGGATYGTLEPITPDTVPMSREELFAPVKAEIDRLKLSAFVPNVATTNAPRQALREYCEADVKHFDDFCDAAKGRIRRAADRITKQRHKASGKPPGGPWHVIFNGSTVMRYGYPSRAEALGVVRWGFNNTDARIRNNWRNAVVTVEYRA